MNWSTRLRRWVRISTPPVREASMKPTAATVLPAPVACSNQKRRSAPGSSGASSIVSSSSSAGASSQSCGSSSGASSSSSRAASPSAASPSSPASPASPASFAAGAAEGSVSSAVSTAPLPLASSAIATCCSAISSVSVPESASTWCGLSSAPSRSFGGSSASRRSRPSSREKSRRHWIDGSSAPASSSFRAASRARRRAVPGASASGPSPSSRKGSRTNFAARSMSALDGTAARAATSLVLAMKAFGFRPRRNSTQMGGGTGTRMPGVCFALPPALSAACIADANRTYVL